MHSTTVVGYKRSRQQTGTASYAASGTDIPYAVPSTNFRTPIPGTNFSTHAPYGLFEARTDVARRYTRVFRAGTGRG
eukprot:23566-Rhodomonas_salina.2